MTKKGFAPTGNEDKRECRTVHAYGTVVMWSTYDTCVRYGHQVVNVRYVRTVRSSGSQRENNLTYRTMCRRRSVRYVRTVRKCIEWRKQFNVQEDYNNPKRYYYNPKDYASCKTSYYILTTVRFPSASCCRPSSFLRWT